jgi:hypothetical protein
LNCVTIILILMLGSGNNLSKQLTEEPKSVRSKPCDC